MCDKLLQCLPALIQRSYFGTHLKSLGGISSNWSPPNTNYLHYQIDRSNSPNVDPLYTECVHNDRHTDLHYISLYSVIHAFIYVKLLLIHEYFISALDPYLMTNGKLMCKWPLFPHLPRTQENCPHRTAERLRYYSRTG